MDYRVLVLPDVYEYILLKCREASNTYVSICLVQVGARQGLSFAFDHDDFCCHHSPNSQHHWIAGNPIHRIVVEI